MLVDGRWGRVDWAREMMPGGATLCFAMTRHFFSILCLVLLCQCETSHSIDRSSQAWNANRVWKAMPGTLHYFLPNDMLESSLPNTAGHWVCDPQDDWRFYVPEAGTKGYRRDVLEGEAWKATNRHTHSAQSARNVLTLAALPLHVATLGVWHPRCWVNTSQSGQEMTEDPLFETDDMACPPQRESTKKSSHTSKHESHHEAHTTKHESPLVTLRSVIESSSKSGADKDKDKDKDKTIEVPFHKKN